MKKIALMFFGAFSIWLSLGSCKHEYVCDCDRTYITGDSTGASVKNYTLYPYTDTKKRAENRCRTNNTTAMDNIGAYTLTCKLK